MDRINCKSCGGALQKVSSTEYRCMFCGSVHELGVDDSSSVRQLLEQNNERWLVINKKMEAFFAAVNGASALVDTRRARFRRLLLWNAFGLAMLVALGMAMFNAFDAQPERSVGAIDLLPFWVVGGVVLFGDLMFALSSLFGRSRLKAELADAHGIIDTVLASYRTMSGKPAKQLLGSLHNRRFLVDGDAEQLAFRIYDEASAGPAVRQG